MITSRAAPRPPMMPMTTSTTRRVHSKERTPSSSRHNLLKNCLIAGPFQAHIIGEANPGPLRGVGVGDILRRLTSRGTGAAAVLEELVGRRLGEHARVRREYPWHDEA